MNTHSKQHQESMSTVQLSPFAEEQWSRIMTYSPIYVQWTDLAMTSPKRTSKPTSAKRNLGSSVNIDAMKLEEELLLNEIQQIRRTVARSKLKQKSSYREAKFLDEERDRQTTSPTDEYQRSTDFFHQTREPAVVNRQSKPQSSTTQSMKVLPNINFGPKPQASLSVQLRQSAITREHVLATSTDHRIVSPLTMCSSRRPVGSAHSGRRANPPNRAVYSQTPQTIDSNGVGGLYEQLSTDSSSTIRRSQLRSTNTSRSNVHIVKTKNDRARRKQHIELKTILVQPCRQPTSVDSDLEQSIPNSIDFMRKIGGSIPAFENNLRYNYHRQLNQFRNGATKY